MMAVKKSSSNEHQKKALTVGGNNVKLTSRNLSWVSRWMRAVLPTLASPTTTTVHSMRWFDIFQLLLPPPMNMESRINSSIQQVETAAVYIFHRGSKSSNILNPLFFLSSQRPVSLLSGQQLSDDRWSFLTNYWNTRLGPPPATVGTGWSLVLTTWPFLARQSIDSKIALATKTKYSALTHWLLHLLLLDSSSRWDLISR